MDQDNENQVNQTNEHSIEEIEVYIQQLEKIRKQYSEDCNYIEADKINDKIKQIKATLNAKKRKNLENQHTAEMSMLDENFNKEMEVFNSNWDSKIKEFEQNSRKMEDEMNLRHKNEMESLAKQLESSANNVIKFPPEYLNLKRSELNLSKQQRFKEAEYVKQKRMAIERDESEKFKKQNNDKFKGKLEKLAHKQFLEKQALRKKIEAGLDALEKERKSGEEKLNRRYKGRTQELSLQQQQEKLLNENENLLKKRTATGKFPQKPQHLMMRTTAEGGFSTTNMVNFNSNSGNKLRSVKNYSPKNVEDNQSDNVEKSAKNEENTEQYEQNEQNEQNQNLSNNDLQQSA